MTINETLVVESDESGTRLDSFLASRIPEISRSKIRRAITDGQVLVNSCTAKPAYRLNGGETVVCQLEKTDSEGPIPEDIPLEVLFEDDDLAVVNKPSGMVVHPSKGHWQGTLTAALAFRFQSLSTCNGSERPGIVHRLDRDTSGAIVIARHDQAHAALAKQFENREVEKEYLAIVSPPPELDRDWIEQPIGPHPYQREKMSIRKNHPKARDARTFYEVVERYGRFAQIRAFPKTGRTHQIRLHLQFINCPIVADKLYSGQNQLSRKDLGCEELPDQPVLERQALHARRLKFRHPNSNEEMEFVAPIANDIQTALNLLQELKTG